MTDDRLTKDIGSELVPLIEKLTEILNAAISAVNAIVTAVADIVVNLQETAQDDEPKPADEAISVDETIIEQRSQARREHVPP